MDENVGFWSCPKCGNVVFKSGNVVFKSKGKEAVSE